VQENKRTKVVSFRVPEEDFQRIERAAGRRKKQRAEFVKGIFMPVFNQIADMEKPERKPAVVTS
jgi:hypothetical protein